MKRTIFIAASLAVCLAATGLAVAGEGQEVDQAAMMAAWQKAMTPGAPHEELAAHAGEWTYISKMWMEPDAPPVESSGKSKIAAIMGGRYLTEKVEGSMMGMPMEGMSLTGYNNITKMYQAVWVDNMGTGIMFAEGTKDGNAITLTGSTQDPMGNTVQVKMVTIFKDKDHHIFEYYADGHGDEMVKVMEMAYSRVGSEGASGD